MCVLFSLSIHYQPVFLCYYFNYLSICHSKPVCLLYLPRHFLSHVSFVSTSPHIYTYISRKLHTEIAILRRLDHPNIVKLQDVFFGRRSVYLVTELCRYFTLYLQCALVVERRGVEEEGGSTRLVCTDAITLSEVGGADGTASRLRLVVVVV